jgi:peptidoglycan hydrolase-like protein with peptidoglycan-binding domain
MAGEPVLSRGSVGEWVQYLAVKLHQHGWWYGDQTWTFNSDLEQAVQGFQATSGLPATGVVDADTWRALAGDELGPRDGEVEVGPGTHAVLPSGHPGQSQSGQSQPGQSGHSDRQGGPLSADHAPQPSGTTGHAVGPPTLQFTFGPDQPVAEADWDTGTAQVHVALSFSGTITATFPDAPDGVTYDVTGGGWSAAASAAMGQLTSGLYVSGLDTGHPAVGCSLGTSFAQTSVELSPPTLTVGGQAQVATTVQTDHGPVQLTGSPGYSLAVTITPHGGQHPDPGIDIDWQQVAITAGLLTGAVLLVAAYLFAPEVSVPATAGAAFSL